MTEPAAQAQPLAQPQPEPSASVTEPTPVAEAPKAKKSKTRIVVGVSAAALLVLGGGGIGVAYTVTHSPENMALSTVSKFLKISSGASASSINGKLELSLKSNSTDVYTNCGIVSGINCVPAKNPLEKVEIDLLANADENSQNATTAVLKVTYDGESYEASLGTVVIKDYTLYVSVDGLKDAASKITKTYLSDYFEDYAALYGDLIQEVVGEIDGKWWKISVPELIDEIDELKSSDKVKAKEAYSCIVDAISKAQTKSDDYIKIYKDNAFVTLNEYKGNKTFSGTGTAYAVSVDADKYTSFANAMTSELDKLGIDNCLETAEDISGVSTSYEIEEIDKDDVEEMLEGLPDIVVTIDKGLFDNNLTGIYIEKEDTEYSGKIEFNFNKSTGEVKAPENAKSATSLYSDIMKKIEEWQETAECKYVKQNFPAYYNSYCDANYHVLNNMDTTSSSAKLLNV